MRRGLCSCHAQRTTCGACLPLLSPTPWRWLGPGLFAHVAHTKARQAGGRAAGAVEGWGRRGEAGRGRSGPGLEHWVSHGPETRGQPAEANLIGRRQRDAGTEVFCFFGVPGPKKGGKREKCSRQCVCHKRAVRPARHSRGKAGRRKNWAPHARARVARRNAKESECERRSWRRGGDVVGGVKETRSAGACVCRPFGVVQHGVAWGRSQTECSWREPTPQPCPSPRLASAGSHTHPTAMPPHPPAPL